MIDNQVNFAPEDIHAADSKEAERLDLEAHARARGRTDRQLPGIGSGQRGAAGADDRSIGAPFDMAVRQTAFQIIRRQHLWRPLPTAFEAGQGLATISRFTPSVLSRWCWPG
jgi:hypothetical protein